MRILPPLFCVLLLVGGVSGVEMKKVTLSVMKGDNVTLKPDDAEIPANEQILWRFEGSIIVNVKNLKDGDFTYDPDRRFKEKLLLVKETGSLTITNLTTDNTGLYQLEIWGKTEIFKNYSVTVHDAVKTVSVMEGESVTVPTGVTEIQGYDQILWKFKDNSVAEINKGTNLFLVYDSDDVRFKGRLQLNEKSGSLIISNSRTTDSGDYHLNMSSSSHFLQRTISVTVNEQGLTNLEKTLIGILVPVLVLVLVLVVAIAGFVIYWKKCRQPRQNHATAGEGNGLAKESGETEVL